MKGGFLSKRQFARGWSLLALFAVMFGVGLMTTSGEVFADQRMCSTLQYTSNTEGYDSPSMKICANTNDDGVIQSGLSVSYTGNFNQSTFTNDPSYNGSVTIGSSNNTDGKGEISIKAVSSSSRGDGIPATTNPSTVSYQYGSTSFSKLANSIFAPFSSGYSYAESESQTVQMVKIGEDGGCDATQLMGGSYGCEPGDYEVTKVVGDTGSTAFYYFEMNGSEWMLSCGGAAGCGAGNSVWTAALDPITVQYERKVIDHEPEPITGTEGEGEEGEDGDEEDDPCYSNSGAMGWIMCPIISGASDALQDLYEDVLQDFLQIDPALLSSEDQGTYEAWNIFRNLANVALIIIFLVVIISQLTGYGINNYGIKKMLPRLVVLAILINLSYVACQLLVDLSNVVGASLHAFLNSIADGLHSSITINGEPAGMGAANLLTAILGVGGVAVLGVGIATGLIGWAIIIPILVAVVAAVLAVVFMFILLGIRQAVIVLLVALSPILIVLYILPNTQNVAKRGLNLFTGLLMMFPLAGLLIGGCHLASAILLTSATGASTYDWLIQILAVLLLVVPFFLLPWLVKSTFAAADSLMGKVVARGQGITGNLRGRAREGMSNSERARLAETRRMERRSVRLQGLRQRSSQKNVNYAARKSANATKKIQNARAILDDPTKSNWQKKNAAKQIQAAQSDLVAAGNILGRANKAADEEAMIAVQQEFAGAGPDVIAKAMGNDMKSGFANTAQGQHRFAAMAAMLSGMGGQGASQMQTLMSDTAIGSANAGNLETWQKALNPGVVKQLNDASIATGEMAKNISGVKLKDEEGKAIKGAYADEATINQQIANEIAGSSAAKLASQGKGGFATSLKFITQAKAQEIMGNPDLRSKISGSEDDPKSNLGRLAAIAWPPNKGGSQGQKSGGKNNSSNGKNEGSIPIPH